ncbi:MAG: lipoyl(octanoyl) transferase LipB [Verrucomicrobiota bacterium]
MGESVFDCDVRWLGRVGYEETLTLQNELVEERKKGDCPDTVLLLEHEAVYTIGRTLDQSSVKSEKALPHPLLEINRGGQGTYHGPGQLVVYPILDLNPLGRDLHVYLRALEESLIDFCQAHGVSAGRRQGLTGVWVEDRKLASIGVGVRRWVSMHGLAMNVCGDLSPFGAITPCGIAGVEMTSLELEDPSGGWDMERARSAYPTFLKKALAVLAEKPGH